MRKLFLVLFLVSLSHAQEPYQVTVPKPKNPSSKRPFDLSSGSGRAPLYVSASSLTLDNKDVKFDQFPSMGCNIKWK